MPAHRNTESVLLAPTVLALMWLLVAAGPSLIF
jgi:hypothetical protein